MSTLVAWARQLITLVMVVLLTMACVRPNLKGSFAAQQVQDDDDHDDDESGNQVEKQLQSLSSGLRRCRQKFASTGTLAVRPPALRHPSGRPFRSAFDRSLLRPRLLLRLQI